MNKIQKIKSFLTIVLLVCCGWVLKAQQLTHEPSTFTYGFAFNPALTAMDNEMSFGGIYRKQWFGFSGSPQHLGIFVQYPFFDFDISGGGYLIHDREGPYRSSTVGFTGAYKLPELFSYEDELTLGIGVKFNTTSVNFDQLIARDQVAFNQSYNNKTANILEIDFGAFYVSDASTKYNSRYFGGIGFNNLKSIFVSDKKTNRLYDVSSHYNLVFGYDYRNFNFGYKKEGFNFFFKPMIWLDYAWHSPLKILVGADLGMTDFLYGGFYFSNESTFHMKLAANINNESLGDGHLKIELFPSYNFGKLKKIKGFGIDLTVAYIMNMD